MLADGLAERFSGAFAGRSQVQPAEWILESGGMELPSSELTRQLTELGLNVPAEIRRCAPCVRRLARGLPTTDTVWIDALVVLRRLTPYQARRLEAGQGEELLLGHQYVLQAPVHQDPVLKVFEAISRGRKTKSLVSCWQTTSAEGDEPLQRLVKIIRSLASCRDRISALPVETLWERGQLCLVSPHSEGESLSRLLVRRGRFPEEVVRGLALDLMRQLQAAEPFAVHGDIRLGNLRLSRSGELVVLNWGLMNAAAPVVTIHTPLPEDAHDVLAPERIDGQRRATVASDIYASGCVLWQLLAGRPPFTLVDPLTKIAAHRTKVIPDVRTLAPETSEALALLIRNMTAREPNRRLQTYAEIRQQLSGSGRSRGNLREFSRTFELAAPASRIETPKKRSRVPAMAASLLLTAVLVTVAWNRERLGLPELPNVVAAIEKKSQATQQNVKPAAKTVETNAPRTVEQPAVSQSDTAPASKVAAELTKLPAPQNNIVQLSPDGHYLAASLVGAGELVLTTDPERPATIHIRDAALSLTADRVRVEHVRIVVEASSPGTASVAPVQVQSSSLALEHVWCGLKKDHPALAVVNWETTESRDAGRLLVRDCEFVAYQDLLAIEGPLSAALFENVATNGTLALLRLQTGAAAGLKVPVMLNACTLRSSGPVVSLPTGQRLQRSGRISLQGADTLVDLAPGEGLLEVRGNDSHAGWDTHVEIAAQGIVVPQDLILALVRNPATQTIDELDAAPLMIDGLLSGRYQFLPPPAGQNGRERLQIESLPVRFSDRLPGVNPARLPSPLADF
ncbi:Serine/threonine protein kinase [Planctomicrobium piriforme]|uniref:non-specific serine/threonine protein kinase n=2 Tax=Planctomicrobium piriforme TaxID=1576369 RepID=A0A1I3AVG9_9PLAN|nr:Serine/threonine protein kinase [Planctomicrobium piriforme]